MDISFYQDKIENMLSNQDYYEKLDKNPQKEIMIKYYDFAQKYRSNLTKKEFDYLTEFETKPSNFYGLPKIHKSKEINEACSLSKEN